MELLFAVDCELLSFELDWSGGFFFGLFDFELLFFHGFGFGLCGGWLFAFLLLFLFLFLLSYFWFWNLCFLSPFFNQVAVFEGYQSVFGEFDFETDTESFVLRVLGWGSVVTDVFTESIYARFVLNQDFNWLFSFEFDCLARWDLGSEVVNHFSLSLWVFG